jgi:hypothetical protein
MNLVFACSTQEYVANSLSPGPPLVVNICFVVMCLCVPIDVI